MAIIAIIIASITAWAEATPKLEYTNALLKINKPTIVVALSGPPPVIMYALKNTWKEPITPVTSKKRVVGLRRGTIIYLIFLKNVAPSRSAASN